MPFMERGAQPLLDSALESGRLELTPNPAAVAGAATVILTIGTPIDEFLNPTLRMIKQCVDALLPHLSDGQLIVLRSTVYPTVTDWLMTSPEGIFARTSHSPAGTSRLACSCELPTPMMTPVMGRIF